ARGALEGGEAGRMEDPLAPAARHLPAAAGGRERGRCADEAADQERARPAEPVVAVHGTIVPMRDGRCQIATIGDVMLDVIVRLVGDDGERSMASDRGVAPTLAPDELEGAWLDCDVLHVSGYALLREPMRDAALLATQLARGRGARVSVDVAAWTEIRAYGPV